jgi:dihydropteroate synthase
MDSVLAEVTALDNQLSNRHIDLDPGGYFIIYVNREERLIQAKHYTNVINDKGLACDPETGKPFASCGKLERTPTQIYSGRSAKEICVQLFEQNSEPCPVTRLDHAAYLGREFQRAEAALLSGQEYIQD